jgi:hypothetical protein
VVALESIASAHGSGLAGATQSATTQPLPVTLGGIGVQVTASAGATAEQVTVTGTPPHASPFDFGLRPLHPTRIDRDTGRLGLRCKDGADVHARRTWACRRRADDKLAFRRSAKTL